MSDFAGFVAIGAIALLAAMSPGPDFVLVTKNSLLHSRLAGVWTGVGIGLGILAHVAYSLAGIGLVIANSILVFSILKYLGSAYLIYLGVGLLREKHVPKNALGSEAQGVATPKSARTAFGEGFLNSALNPKTTIFFLSVFTQMIDPGTRLIVQVAYGVETAVVVGLWFWCLAALLTTRGVRTVFDGVRGVVSKVMGGLLVALGVKVALSTSE